MKQILQGDPVVKTVLGIKEVMPGTVYRWSDFVLTFSHKGEGYLYNNFTKIAYALEGEVLNTASDARFSFDEIKDSQMLTALVAGQFLVPEAKDEATAYENFLRIARILRAKNGKKGYKTFIILPTTACNARCIYCFEQGMEYVTMTEDTVEQTIRFILENHSKGDTLNIGWFGGEPLIGEKTIDRVCDALTEAGVTFRSKITTNGSLITPEIIEKMKNRWHVASLQITLDGVEEEYNRRKNYYFNYPSAYWHVLSNIRLLNENHVLTCIRVNMDEKNIGGVKQMLSEIERFMPHPETIVTDLVPLFDVREREDGIGIWEQVFELNDYVDTQTVFNYSDHGDIKKLRLHHCMADSPTKAVTIGPDGKLFNCENLDSFDSLGNIYDGVTDPEMIRSFSTVEKTADKCRGCLCLPSCTTFTRCKNPALHCKYYMRRYLESAFARFLDNNETDTGTDEFNDEI